MNSPNGSYVSRKPRLVAKSNLEELALATQHVERAKQIIARQRQAIARLQAMGCNSLDAEQTLEVFLRTLEIFEDHKKHLQHSGPRQIAT